MRIAIVLAVLFLVSVLLPTAAGHAERDAEFPDGTGSVPAYRTDGPVLVVCKQDSAARIDALPEPARGRNEALLGSCAFEHIQAAVDAVTAAGSRILVLPGVYHEEPSLAPGSGECADVAETGILSYEDHHRCPNAQNLIGIMGDDPDDPGRDCTTERLCHLQIEGTGAVPEDVVIDNAWNKLNAIRADRADGFYLYNLLVQRTEFNSVYILETDGFAIDSVVARWNWEYGFLTFAVDHGLYVDCEAYGNGDAGIYPGSASDLHGTRPSVEITRCDSHHNMAGYSGTAGNSVYVHDNDFHHNSVGVVMDSLFPGHPGLPQDAGTFVGNRVYSNNENFYDNFLGPDAPCFRPIEDMGIEEGTVCPTAPVPVGTGMMVAGGNDNLFADNHVWDNWRYGFVLFTVPAVLRDETDPLKQLDTSHFNRYLDNHMDDSPEGLIAPNGMQVWWDEGGAGNCWSRNHAHAGWTSDPPGFLLPTCEDMPLVQRPPNAAKLATIAPCALYDPEGGLSHPPGCPWLSDPTPPGAATDPLSWFTVPARLPAIPWVAPSSPAGTIHSANLDGTVWWHSLADLAEAVSQAAEEEWAHGPKLNT